MFKLLFFLPTPLDKTNNSAFINHVRILIREKAKILKLDKSKLNAQVSDYRNTLVKY